MYAVIRTGGKQYRVSQGDRLRVEKLAGDVGASVTIGEVLMLGGGEAQPRVGKPLIAGATVEAEITAQDRARKVIVFHKRRRKGYEKRAGHRQSFTELTIRAINAK